MLEPRKIPPVLVYGIPIFLAGALKLLVWSPQVTPFNADEAIVALMARHINQGQLMPFFYGQSYMGSFDAILVALFFKLFGESVWIIRLVQCLLYLGTVATTIMLGARLLGSSRKALYAGLLVAIPPVNVTLYSTVSLGGYGEMLLMGNLLLLSGWRLLDELQWEESFSRNGRLFGWFFWSIGAGLAFWVIGLSLVYTIPVLLILIWEILQSSKTKKAIIFKFGIVAVLGFLVGSAPWWISAVATGNGSILTELLGGAIADVNSNISLLKPMIRIRNLLVFGGTVITGIRPPWGISWLMLPLIPFVLTFWIAVLISSGNQLLKTRNRGFVLLFLIGIVLSMGFILAPYGDDPSGRYFLPLVLPMAILGSEFISRGARGNLLIEWGLIALVLIFNLGGTLQSRLTIPPGLTTQFDPVAQVDQRYTGELLMFLGDQNITTGYSNYWVSYPVAFLSEEQIIFSPRLPYHQDFRYTERDDRYLPYTEQVESSDEIAYIVTRHPALEAYLQERFGELGISWEEKRIGDYTVYYDLTAPVHVNEIGLGTTTLP
ncbi:MAG: glycosyltransferase family 39 protein [Anaerolineales bacterium]